MGFKNRFGIIHVDFPTQVTSIASRSLTLRCQETDVMPEHHMTLPVFR